MILWLVEGMSLGSNTGSSPLIKKILEAQQILMSNMYQCSRSRSTSTTVIHLTFCLVDSNPSGTYLCCFVKVPSPCVVGNGLGFQHRNMTGVLINEVVQAQR